MAGVGPAQELLVREIRDAGGGDELAADAGALDQGGVRPTQQAAGIIGERCGRGECRPDERCTPPRLQTVADDIADDQHGGILRPLSHQVKVAADLFGGGGQERRGKFQAGALGQLGRGERIPDRAQILQLMLRRLKALTQHGEIPFAHCGFFAQARDQRLLTVLSVIHIVDVALLGGNLGAQPPKLSFVFTGVFAHAVRGTPCEASRVPVESSRIAGPDCPGPRSRPAHSSPRTAAAQLPRPGADPRSPYSGRASSCQLGPAATSSAWITRLRSISSPVAHSKASTASPVRAMAIGGSD